MDAVSVEGSVAALCAGVDGLLSDDLTGLDSAGVVGLVREVERQRRRLAAVDARLLAEVGERSLTGDLGRLSALDLLVGELRVAPVEARRRIAQSRDMGPRRALSGEVLAPIFPAVAQAQADGSISASHASVITEAVVAISPDAGLNAGSVAERYLVEAAMHENPVQLRGSAVTLLAHLNPDGVEPAEERALRRRSFSLRPAGDGSFTPTGSLTGEAAAVWQTLLNALSQPAPAADGTRDERSAGQRRHDALLDAGLRLLRSGSLPDCGGVPVTVLARTTLTDLQRMADTTDAAGAGDSGVAVTEHGDLMSLRALLKLGCQADIVTVLLDDLGGILDHGRTRRLASPEQRRALSVRDGGCCFPGCDRPPSWAETHHIIEWINLGPTDIDNLCLLCPHHHRSFEHQGWVVEMTDRRPRWIPPPWIDHNRKPRRNRAHHLDDINFDKIDCDEIDHDKISLSASPGREHGTVR